MILGKVKRISGFVSDGQVMARVVTAWVTVEVPFIKLEQLGGATGVFQIKEPTAGTVSFK